MLGAFLSCSPRDFNFCVATVLLPFSEFWAYQNENDLLHSAKYNPGLHVEKTAFASANLPFFSRKHSGILLDGS